MTAKHHTTFLATTLLAASLLAGCGGSDGDPEIKPVTGASSSSSAATDPDGFTPEQRVVADAAQAYTEASFARGSDPIDGSPVAALITDELRTQLSDLEQQVPDDQKRDFIGTQTLAPESVTVDGDTATFVGCQDGSKAYSVKAGETTPGGAGSSIIGFTKLDFSLKKQDGRWLVDDPKGESVASC